VVSTATKACTFRCADRRRSPESRSIMVEVGKRAPAFTLQSADGSKVSLADFKGKRVVLYFYPKDNTPGCTLQAQDFQKALPTFKKRNAVVLGVSRDSLASHCKFRDKFGLAFPLLSDPDHEVLEAYGAWGEKNLYGKKTVGTIRTTVLVDEQGKISRVFPSVKVKGHVEAVLEALG
jgi:thioredoxin-dependent peroxiredoxin